MPQMNGVSGVPTPSWEPKKEAGVKANKPARVTLPVHNEPAPSSPLDNTFSTTSPDSPAVTHTALKVILPEQLVKRLQEALLNQDEEALSKVFDESLNQNVDFAMLLKSVEISQDEQENVQNFIQENVPELIKGAICDLLPDQKEADKNIGRLFQLSDNLGYDTLDLFQQAVEFIPDDYQVQLGKELLGKYMAALIMQDKNAFNVLAKSDSPLDLLTRIQTHLPKKSPEAHLAQELLVGIQTLMHLPGETEPLTEKESAAIAHFIHQQFDEKKESEPFYCNPPHLARTLIIAPKTRSVYVLSKEASELQERGAEKKATYTTQLSFIKNGAEVKVFENQYVRLVNWTKKEPLEASDLESNTDEDIPEELEDDDLEIEEGEFLTVEEAQVIVDAMKKEMDLFRRFNGDLLLMIEHKRKVEELELPKLTVIVENYPRDIESLFLDQSSMKSEQVHAIFAGIVNKLTEIHEAGFAYYDLHGKNIRFTMDSLTPKFIDFGLSHNGKDYPKSVDELGYGTIRYSAPETCDPANRLPDQVTQSQAEDMAALGCLLYLMLYKEEIPSSHDMRQVVTRMQAIAQKEAEFKETEPSSTDLDELQESKEKLPKLIKNFKVESEKVLARLKKDAAECKDPVRKKDLECCMRLLNPLPANRITAPELRELLS